MRAWTLPKFLTFPEDERENITFSNTALIRLNPDTAHIELKVGEGGYSTDANIYAITQPTQPAAVLQWIGFQADIILPKDVNGIAVGSIGYRLHDGTNQWYWNGSAWVQGTSVWNTEAEVAAHISAFNATTTHKLRIVINLVTTDQEQTPSVSRVRLAYRANIESQFDDVLYRTLAPALKEQLRPAVDFLGVGSGSVTINFGAVADQSRSRFDITDVDAVWDITDDPGLTNDLLGSYAPSTRTITLTSSVASSHRLQIRALYRPEVVVIGTAVDFIEVEQVPAVHLIGPETMSRTVGAKIEVVDKAAGTALVWPGPRVDDLRFDVFLHAPTGKDLQRLVSAMDQFIRANGILRTYGTDEAVQLTAVAAVARGVTQPNLEGVFSTLIPLNVMGLLEFDRRALTSDGDGVYPILEVRLTGGVDLTVVLGD